MATKATSKLLIASARCRAISKTSGLLLVRRRASATAPEAGRIRSPRQFPLHRRAVAGSLRPVTASIKHPPPCQVDVDGVEHRFPNETVLILHGLVLNGATPVGAAHAGTLRRLAPKVAPSIAGISRHPPPWTRRSRSRSRPCATERAARRSRHCPHLRRREPDCREAREMLPNRTHKAVAIKAKNVRTNDAANTPSSQDTQASHTGRAPDL